MVHTPLILAQLDADLTYADGGAGGTGTGTGALRYRDGHTGGVQAALVEEGTTNWVPNATFDNSSTGGHPAGWNANDAVSIWTETANPWQGAKNARVEQTTGRSNIIVSVAGGVDMGNPAGGDAWTVSAYHKGSVGTVEAIHNFVYTAGTGGGSTPFGTQTLTMDGAWQRSIRTQTATGAKDIDFINTTWRHTASPSGSLYTWPFDAVQVEHTDHVTSFCPEFSSGTTLATGYAWAGTAFNSASTRTAAKIELPCSAPDWLACRYSEDFGTTWSFAYVTNLTGNNVGTYGKISHDGTNLVVESDRALVLGPLYAGTGSLGSTEQDTLAEADAWTFGMDLIPDAPVVNAGADDATVIFVEWTRSGSFTDEDSTDWTAAVDYDDGDGAEVLALDGMSFDLSHMWTTAGEKTVTVSVTDDGELTGTNSITVTVVEGYITGSFIISSVTGVHSTAPVVTLP